MKNQYSVRNNVVTMLIERKGKTPAKVLFSLEDLPKIEKFDTWSLHGGYAVTYVKGKMKRMNRVLLGVRSAKLLVDYIDGDKLNNIRINLRKVTRRQDAKNITKTFDRKNNTTGYKGVSYHTKKKHYQVRIGVDGVIKWIGGYSTAIEAAKAYDEAARAYHGEFAYLNFPRRDLMR